MARRRLCLSCQLRTTGLPHGICEDCIRQAKSRDDRPSTSHLSERFPAYMEGLFKITEEGEAPSRAWLLIRNSVWAWSGAFHMVRHLNRIRREQ